MQSLNPESLIASVDEATAYWINVSKRLCSFLSRYLSKSRFLTIPAIFTGESLIPVSCVEIPEIPFLHASQDLLKEFPNEKTYQDSKEKIEELWS